MYYGARVESRVENGVAVPQKVKPSSNIQCSDPTSGQILKSSETRASRRSPHTHVHSNIKCLSVNERINKMWPIHTTEY